jgi:CTP:molybdopterin cytidylyltransferase MocA
MPTDLPPPWALVLAAGESRRFGAPKLTAPVRGKPLIHWSLVALNRGQTAGLVGGMVVVVRADDEELRRTLPPGLETVSLPSGPSSSLSQSLKAGLAALAARPGPSVPAALICLADQPALRVDVIAALVTAWRATGSSVLRPRYVESPDEPGHPLLLDRSVWSLADDATGDSGLGPLLKDRPDLVRLVEVAGGNPDVDTPADLARLIASRDRN